MLPTVRGLNDPDTTSDSDDELQPEPSLPPQKIAKISSDKMLVYAKTMNDIEVFDGDETYPVSAGTRLRCSIPNHGVSNLQNDLPVSFISNSSNCEITKGYITPEVFRTLTEFSL